MKRAETVTQYSAGGVAFRKEGDQVYVAVISVGKDRRWGLPKGGINQGETSEAAALREVREEAGIQTEMIAPLGRIDFWFYAKQNSKSVRIHKYVDFYLLRFLSGETSNHDHEVNEARWVKLNAAYDMLTYESEKEVLQKARLALQQLDGNGQEEETYDER